MEYLTGEVSWTRWRYFFFQSRRSKACREKSAETIVPDGDSIGDGSNLTEVNTTNTIK